MRYLSLLTIVFLVFTVSAEAQYSGDSQVHTIAEIMEMPDDTHVIAEGYITRRVGDEEYMFEDDSGEIQIEIDDDLWRGREVDGETRVRIFGELEKRWLRSSEIEVDRFEIL